jgi:superfamily II DNA or RNA helicase
MLIVQIAPTRPDLALTDGAIRALIPHAVLEAGRLYELRGRVQDLRIDDGGAAITAHTIDSEPEPYTQRLNVGRGKNGALLITGRCSCPVGYLCKHIAAVLIAAHRRQLAGDADPDPAIPRLTAAHAQPMQRAEPVAPKPDAPLPYEITGWLTALEQAEDADTEEYPPGIRNRVLYVLDAEPVLRAVAWLRIQPVVAMLRKDDSVSNAKPYPLQQVRTPARYLRPSDRLILHRLAARGAAWQGSGANDDPIDTLRRIIATGRALWGNPYGPRVSEGPAQPGTIVWHVDPDGSQHTLLELDGGRLPIRVPAPWYAEPATGVVGPVALDLLRPVAEKLLSAPPIPAEMVPKVRAELAKRLPARPVPAPRELNAPEPLTQAMRSHLRLISGTLPNDPGRGRGSAKPVGQGLWAVPVARLSFDYGPVSVPSTQKTQPRIFARDGVLYEPARDPTAEAEALDRLRAIGFGRVSHLVPVYYQHAHTDDFALMEGDVDTDWMTVVTQELPRLRAEGWTIEIDDTFPVQVVTADTPIDGALVEDGRIDWLELRLGVMVDGERVDLVPPLIKMIGALKGSLPAEGAEDDTFTLPLPDGRLLVLPMARIRPTLAALMELAASGVIDPGADKIGFSKLDAVDLVRMEERAGLIWRGGEALRELGRQLRAAGGAIPHAEVPSAFHGALRPYQAQGVDWLQFLRGAGLGGVLADDMGLGKTVQTLAHLAIEQGEGRLTHPALIVCPTSLIPNWTMETEKFAPSLRVLPLHGPNRKEHFGAIPNYDLVLTTYPLLTRDHEVLTEQEWHAVILDEAQLIKNPNAETTRQALRLKAGQRLCLSGTPLQNHLGELWSLFDFLAPGFLGSQKGFRARYRTPIEKHGDVERQDLLARRVRPFLLRRTKEEVVQELPPKTEITEPVEMEAAQRAIYDAIRLSMHTRVQAAIAERGLARSGIIILDALLKMRQACCDPRLLKLKAVERAKAGSAKLDRLMEMLAVMLPEGRRVLLFSQFTEMLGLIERRLLADGVEYVLLTGDTKDRRTPVKRFQAGEVPVFLISLKAGGVGLNLTAADTVIHYDPWWNPAVEDQATDRAHRIGQSKKVFVHRLVTLGTIEEKMEVLKEKKRGLVASVLEAEHGGALKLTEADVAALFEAG